VRQTPDDAGAFRPTPGAQRLIRRRQQEIVHIVDKGQRISAQPRHLARARIAVGQRHVVGIETAAGDRQAAVDTCEPLNASGGTQSLQQRHDARFRGQRLTLEEKHTHRG